jgi:hypothetical protein
MITIHISISLLKAGKSIFIIDRNSPDNGSDPKNNQKNYKNSINNKNKRLRTSLSKIDNSLDLYSSCEFLFLNN